VSPANFWAHSLAAILLEQRAAIFRISMFMKTVIRLFLAFLYLVALGLKTYAVSPPPDGGYPAGNTAEGQDALLSLTTGGYNTAVGFLSLRSNIIGNFNTATGAGALLVNTAAENTATGAGSLLSNTTGSANTADGTFSLFSNTSGTQNTAIGANALKLNTIGMSNTAIGILALSGNATGNNNTACGAFALFDNSTGNGNIALGPSALFNNRSGSNNIAVGFAAGSGVMTASNVICIGISGGDVSDSFYVANVFETSIDPDNLPVLIDVTGRLGTQSSSRRFKENIRPMDKASEVILALKPVTFRYKNDVKRNPRVGLIAEDVAEVNPDLVVRDKEGKPYSVRYDQVNAMLLNEFLKEHRKVQEQEATIAQLKKDFRATVAQLATRLDEQASQIQKVSARLEASKPVPQVVNNNQ